MWFEALVTCRVSTAAWSALGWLLQLGDRHPENLLMVEHTGGVVHVDFALIFVDKLDVPFRETRNILDGFLAGVIDGAFMT
jgi:phosphatidylinositol kinase/protein kinase (PI-3  family)